MKKISLTLFFIQGLLSILAVRGQTVKEDSLKAFREFAGIGAFYNHLPFDLKVQIKKTTNSMMVEADTLQSDLRLYTDSHEFYMESDGIKEMGNDSLLVMINSNTKQILLYPNRKKMTGNWISSRMALISDSSIDLLAGKYRARILNLGDNLNRIEIKTRRMILATTIPREMITIDYRPLTHEPRWMQQTRFTLLPLDSSSYIQLKANASFAGKLIDTLTKKRRSFFAIREVSTTYRFIEINFSVHEPPLQLNDILRKKEDGEYVVTGKYEDYTLSTEL